MSLAFNAGVPFTLACTNGGDAVNAVAETIAAAIRAVDVAFDDTAAQLGSATAQGAIDALDTRVDALDGSEGGLGARLTAAEAAVAALTAQLEALTDTTNWCRETHRACARAETTDTDTHGLRRTAGCLWLAAGLDIYQVSKLLGHQSVVTTERSYADVATSQWASIFDGVDSRASLPTLPVKRAPANRPTSGVERLPPCQPRPASGPPRRAKSSR